MGYEIWLLFGLRFTRLDLGCYVNERRLFLVFKTLPAAHQEGVLLSDSPITFVVTTQAYYLSHFQALEFTITQKVAGEGA